MKAKKLKKRIRKIKITKSKRVDAFGILKGVPSFSREDEGDSHF